MEAVYHELRHYFEHTPHGFPRTPDGIELKILKKLFTLEHANIFCHILKTKSKLKGYTSASNKKLQKSLKISALELEQKLDDMSKNGLLFRQRLNNDINQPIYYTPGFLVGLYEYSLNTIDQELADLCRQYLKHLADWANSIDTKQMRIIPINKSLDTNKKILPYNNINDLINNHSIIAVAECICTKEASLLGEKCAHPTERCVTFDWYAEHYIDTGLGRQISEDELYDLLKMAEKTGLVFASSNTYPSIGFCLCCSCCCSMFKILRYAPNPAKTANSFYYAEIQQDNCVQCDICNQKCFINAIKVQNEKYSVDVDRCIGCGLCVASCPQSAIEMIDKQLNIKIPSGTIPMCLDMYEDHIYAGHFPKKDLFKVKMAKSVIKTSNLIKNFSK